MDQSQTVYSYEFQIGDEVFAEKSLPDLVEKVVHGFVVSLQEDSADIWQSFNEVLEIIQPYSALIEENAQLTHYVGRTYNHFCENANCGLDVNALSLAFPREMERMKQKDQSVDSRKVKFPSGSPEPSEIRLPVKKMEKRKRNISVPKGTVVPSSDIYDGHIEKSSRVFSDKKLHIDDLRKSLPFVVYEIGLREASWGRPLGMTAAALNIDLADIVLESTSPKDSVSNLNEGSTLPSSLKLSLDNKVAQEEKTERRQLTGREIVQKFVVGNFFGATKFAYLNMAPSKHYDPYNLVVVPRNKKEPEHFVVSSHAILHVIPNGPSELQPLAEWYKEALLFSAILKFNFFKNYLLSKMFLKWRHVKKMGQFRALCQYVGKAMVSSTPSFGSALIRISSLIQDLDQVQFLPLNDLSCKQLQKFNEVTVKLLNDAHECLKMFFTYCLSVINKTREHCFEYLDYCKEQLQMKSQNPKGSLSLAKERKAIKEQNIKLAHLEVYQFQKFVKLVEQILLTKFLTLARHNICMFVNGVLGCEEIKDKGLFSVLLQFDKTDKLVLVPSRHILQGSLFFSVESVLKILCQSSDFLDEEFCESERHMEDTPYPSSERSDSKQTVGASPNRLQSFLISQSPFSGATSSILPAMSVAGRHELNEAVGSEVDSPTNDTTFEVVGQDGRTEKLKSLLEESLQQTIELKKTQDEEDHPETPKACVSLTGGLLVKGKEIQPQRGLTSPLSKSKLEATVLRDEEILAAMSKEEKIVNSALEEVDVFCCEHEWIVEISNFVRTWNKSILASWRGRPPGKIEKQLGEIKTWIEKLSNVKKTFVTDNGLLFVNCSSIHDSIIPKLNAIFRQLTKMVAKDLLRMSSEFSVDVTQLAEKLSNRNLDFKAFAEFILVQKETKKRAPSLQVKVEYIKSLFDMIRFGYRQLTGNEEEAEERTWDSWEKFLLCLQESSDFLLVETSQVLRDVEETIMTFEHQARVIGEKAVSGEFLIPENNPTMILSQLRKLRERLWSLLRRVDELIECREVICGRKYNKSHLLAILNKMDVRYELWKYYDVSAHTINDWLQMPFRKMNVKKVTEKITEWQVAAQNMKSSLSDGDEVYESWIKQMEAFMKDFPLLQQLSMDALKQRHWKALFVGMGQQYDANWQFTIADLFSFKLGLYKDLINSVCSGALHEYTLELQLRSLAKVWTDKDFKLAKHFARTKSSLDSETDSLSEKGPSRQGMRSRQNQSKVNDVYILTGDDELKCLIEDNRVTLQLMLVSPYVADLKPTVEAWMKNLEQLEEILDLWVACQKKWLYLSLVFTENSGSYQKTGADRFEEVDSRFKAFMQSVIKDSKVLSILAKKRGEKNYRELQGEALRSMLFSLLKHQEELLKSVEHNMEQVREAFPRLYFLSDSEVLDAMVISRDPRKLVPIVRKLFSGIKSVRFGFPEDSITKLNTALDAALNAHLLQVTAIEGDFGEVVALADPIAPCIDSRTWLKVLEKSMKTALMMNLTECMVNWSSRRKHVVTAVSDVFSKGGSSTSNTYSECLRSETPWLLKYPSQCLRSVEAATWYNDISHTLSSKDKNKLKTMSSSTSRRVEEYAKVLSGKEYTWLTKILRSRPTLESLLVCAIHQRDVVERLLLCKAVCLHCFEWQSCLHHHITLKEVLSTTYCSGLPGTSRRESSQDQIPLDVKYKTEECNIRLLGSEFPYGFEYLNEPLSLVVTPLTERCFLSLTMSLKNYSCGTPFGSSGTGKTETIKELAKIMGRHLVFFNCSYSMANAVATRLLTGMILSGSWVCFEVAHNLPQTMLSTLGKYLGCIKESYKCLAINKSNEYFSRVTGKADGLKDAEKESIHLHRRHSFTALDYVTVPGTACENPTDAPFSSKTKKSTSVSRRYSIACGRNIDKTQFYDSEQPLPISIPLTPEASLTDCALFSPKDKDVEVSYQQPNDSSLGNIVFNGLLLKAHPMAGSFMTIIPTTNGYLNIPENLKVSLRTVAMMVPDMKRIIEVWLLCNGFSDVGVLVEKISFFIKVIREEFPSELGIETSSLRTAICVAGNRLQLEQSISETTEDEATVSEEELEFKPSKEQIGGISSATSFLEEFENRTNQESAVVFGLFSVLCPKLDENDKKTVCDVIDTVFTHTVLTTSTQTNTDRVAEAVRKQLNAETLQSNMDLVTKVIQLYQVLQTNHAVIIMGSSGTGKTTIYQTLCRAINSLNTQVARDSTVAEGGRERPATSNVKQKFPKVNLSVLFPRAMNEKELFGWIDPVTKLWVDGILVKRACNAQAVKTASDSLSSRMKHEREHSTSTDPGNFSENDFHQWVVLDGPLDRGCVDQMNALFDGSRKLSLASGEMVPLSDTMSFLLELDDLKDAAPSVVSHCGIVYCSDNTIGWKSVFKSWLKGAHTKWNISIRGLGIVSSLMEHCVEKTLTFLSTKGPSILYANYYANQRWKMAARGMHEIQRFLAILSSVFDKHILRDNDETLDILGNLKDQRFSASCSSSETASGRSSSIPASDTHTVISSFAYAFIWAFGGDLHESSIQAFDDFVKSLLSTGPYPYSSFPPVSVFDYHLDFAVGSLLSSTEKLSSGTRTIASSYVVVPRAEVYFSLLDLLVSASKPVLLVGPPGSGKTSFMQNIINPRYSYTRISLAHGMTTQLLQETIEAKVKRTQRRQSVVYNPALLAQASRNLFFLDDLNLAATDGTASNIQPSTEVIRSLLSLGGLYDRERLCLKPLSQTSIVGAAVPPGCPGTGGGVTSFPISPRLARIMVVLSFHPVSGPTLRSIYRNLFQTWLEDFPAYSLTHHHQLAKAISTSTVCLFETISQELRPTPVNPHYIFTHHDVARVLQGMTLFSSRTKNRSRPKIRHKKRVITTTVQNTEEVPVLNDQSLSYHDIVSKMDEKENNLHQEKSWPVVTRKETLVSMNCKTPAVLAPMIRVLLRLWCHECSRIFSDRLTGEDKLWFSSTLHKTAIQQFCETSLDADERGNIAIGVDGIIPTKNSLTSLLGEDVDDDADVKTPKDEESIGGESFAVDDVLTEEDLTTAEGDNSNNENTGDQIGREHRKLNYPCGDHFLPQEVPDGGVGKPAVDSRTTGDNSGDEIQFKSQEPSMPRTAPSKQRVVTFEDMSKEHVYRGPLISPDQLMEQDEDLSKILFCRHFVSTAQETGSDHDRGYNEYSVAALADGLNRCQQLYNSQEAQPLDLVFFEQAVRHAARLSRCLSLFSGHAIFLSQSGHGRKSLVLLASFAANSKLIKLKSNRHEDSRQRIKSAMYLAGLQGKPVVIYVPEDIDQETMLDVSSLMSEGNCPGLFSLSELSAICGELIPGGQRGKRNENLAIAQERFFRRVRTNLRVALSLEHPSNRTHALNVFKFSLYPFLSTRASGVDVYQPWHHNTLAKVSSMRLEDIDMDSDLQDIVDIHLTSVTSVMSFIHRSTLETIAKQFAFNRYKCYSPGTFVEFVDMFGKCCNRIWREEQEKIERYKQALKKVEEANGQINEMQKDLDSFIPILRNAEQEVKNCLELVESLQSEYTKGRGKCKEQEGEIETMMAPIEELERLAKIELDRVSPVFKSAYDALRALNVYDVEEIRSYRTPPDLVVLVVNAVCLLFGMEESWEEGKVLFSQEDFIKDLEFFNMKAISDKTFRRLKEYVENPKFEPDVVKEGSLAAMSVCVWIRAVYHFCVVYRDYFPKQQRVIEAKKILEEAVAYLGDLRVRCNEIKAEVEAKIEEYKGKVHHARSIEKQIQVTEQRKTRAVSLVQSMSVHVQSWEEAFRGCRYHIKTLAGDALLTAACVCYLGPMDQETREKLLGDWKISCQGSTKGDEETEEDDNEDDVDNGLGDYFQTRSSDKNMFTSIVRPYVKRVPVRSDFNLKGVLTTEEELYNWRHSGLPSNATAVENALQMRSICELTSRHWPLLIDTDQQSYMWVKCLHQSIGTKEREGLDSPEMIFPLENPSNYEDVSLPVSPCLTNADQDSAEDQSTNYEESDSATLHSNQSSRRESGAAGSGVLFKEELARELNIQTSPQDYTSTDSASTDVDFDDERIMIISAADRQRDAKLCGAISVGATVILVDVERKKLGTRLDNLLTRNTFIDKNGKRKIRIGSRCIDYHPSFQLYLYTNMPLELTTSAISLPFKKCLVINMALSCEGLQELLLSDVLSLERPEYEAQRRSLEADIYHLKQQIKNAENFILDKVITLQERLLENGAISGALSECGDLCEMAGQQLEESKALYELAKEKQEDYSHVSEHGAALLTIVSKLSKLHSYYQMPFQTTLKLFHDVILQRRRGTRSTGSSLARSAELITYITRSICSRVARSVFSDHYDTFTFLVAVEKLRLAGQISEDEWELFYRFTLGSSAEKRKEDTSADDSAPSWISPGIWAQLIELDVLPGYRGLKDSIQSNSGLWKEYFELPPTLMAPTPSNFHQLSVFQRALLWKTFKKDKLHNVTKDLVLYQLGTNASAVTSYTIGDAYQYTSCITPVIIFIPEAQYMGDWRKRNLKDPVNEIVALATHHTMNDKLRFLDLGGKLLANEATSVLRNACEHGLWLVIQNCHLIAEWLPQLLDIFHQITLSGSKEQIMSKHGIFDLDTNTYTVTSCVLNQSLVMHPQFRLWLITAPEIATPIPAVLIRYGIKLAWDDKITFDTSVRQSFLTVWNQTKRSNKLFEELQIKDVQAEPWLPYLYSLALFHCILHRRCLYGSSSFNIPYHWHYSDLSWGLKAVRLLKSSVLCSCLTTTSQSSALRQTISILYGGQVLDLLDWTSIVALSERHLTTPNLTTQSSDEIGEQSTGILFNRLPLSIDLNDIGLNENFSTEKDINVSNELATDISKMFGILPKSSLSLKPVSYFQEILDAFDDIKFVFYLEQSIDQVGKDESSFITFLDFERSRYLTLLNTITSQLQGIIKGLRGDVSFTSDTRDLAMLLCDEKIPSSWCRRSKSCPPLAAWIASLKNHLQAVLEYSQRPSDMPLTINIAAFLNKQTLFYALLADWSKASGSPIHMLDISIEVCRRSSTQKLTAVDGVYLAGLVLCNASWNETEGCIEEQKEEQSTMPCLLLRPRERNKRQVDCDNEGGLLYLHNCPVYFYDDLSCRSIPNASFSHVALRSRLPSHICQERQVFLTCSM